MNEFGMSDAEYRAIEANADHTEALAQKTRVEARKAERDLDHPARFIGSPAGRAWLYAVVVAAGAVVVGYGLLTADQAQLWLSFLGVVITGGGVVAVANRER